MLHRYRLTVALRSLVWAAPTIALLTPAPAADTEPACTLPPTISLKLKEHPTAELYVEAGKWLGDHRHFACAAREFRLGLKVAPNSAQMNYLLGVSLYSSGQLKEAAAPLQEAVKLSPADIDSHVLLAKVLSEQRDRTGAESHWRAALALDPRSNQALEGLSRDLLTEADFDAVIALLRPIGPAETLTPELVVNLGGAYSKAGRLEEAADLLQHGFMAHPGSSAIGRALSIVLVVQSRTADAKKVLQEVVRQNPGDVDAQVLYLRLLVTNDEPAANEVAQKLLIQAPNNRDVHFLVGLLQQKAGDYRVARQSFQKAVDLSPNRPESHYNLGLVLEQLKNYPEAKNQLEEAVALGSDEPGAHYELFKVLRAMGATEEAQAELKVFQQAKKDQADRTQAASKAELGDQALASGDAQKAISFYREALEMNPHEPLLAYKLAMAYDHASDVSNEREALEQAIGLNPDMAMAQNQLGYLDYRAGNYRSANEHFHIAVKSSPRFLKAWMNLAASLAVESQWQEAKDALRHVLELDPGNPQADELNQRIDEMQVSR